MREYSITIKVTDSDVTPDKLLWLLAEAGEVTEIKENATPVTGFSLAGQAFANHFKNNKEEN